MKRIIILISYLAYFIYGFLFACGYLGGNALSGALQEGSVAVILVVAGIACLLLLFGVSLVWLLKKPKSTNYLILRLLVFVPFLTTLFWYLGGQINYFSGFLSVLLTLFVLSLPLWICVIVSSYKPKN